MFAEILGEMRLQQLQWSHQVALSRHASEYSCTAPQITVLGLLCSMLSFALTSWYAPNFEVGAVPAWVIALSGIGVFAYQTLDNMDGKQARKIGASSSLGLLFDHGCDAINAALVSHIMRLRLCQGCGDFSLACVFAVRKSFAGSVHGDFNERSSPAHLLDRWNSNLLLRHLGGVPRRQLCATDRQWS